MDRLADRRDAEAVREIPLGRGLVALVDASDFDALSAFKWRAVLSARTQYAVRSAKVDGKPVRVFMHRQIMDARRGEEFDHKNRNGLDNRRANLRPCSRAENTRNRASATNATTFKGVCRQKGAKTWRAHIMVDGVQIQLGAFDRPIEAAMAYDLAAVRLHGEFARLNFDPKRDWILPYSAEPRPGSSRARRSVDHRGLRLVPPSGGDAAGEVGRGRGSLGAEAAEPTVERRSFRGEDG